MTPGFMDFGLPVNLAVFVGAAVVVWIAGTRIARYADAINDRTGLGEAMLGLILLGGVTSLPEVAVTVTAASSGNTELAVNNILGSITMQIALLAVADGLVSRRPLTAVVPDPIVLLQGSLNVLMLVVVAAGIVVGDTAFHGIGAWLWGVFALFLYSMWQLAWATRADKPWFANMGDEDSNVRKSLQKNRNNAREKARALSWPRLSIQTMMAAAVILAAGVLLARTGEAIAQQTGLGDSFVGAVLVAVATSLPEVSTVFASVRLGLFTMAISDILGTNLLNGALLFGVDAVDGGEAALTQVGNFGAFSALLGAALTAIFLIGLAERRDRKIGPLGPDSIAVIGVYLGGLAILYTLR